MLADFGELLANAESVRVDNCSCPTIGDAAGTLKIDCHHAPNQCLPLMTMYYPGSICRNFDINDIGISSSGFIA